MSPVRWRASPPLFLFAIALLASVPPASAQPPPGYYAAAEGLTGATLHQALHAIIDDHEVSSYGAAQGWIALLDQDPQDSTRVQLLYSDATAPKSSWPQYNREHLWPQSLGAKRRPAQSDMHHIFAADQNVNSARGNKPFDNCAGDCRQHAEAPDASYTSALWEPPDADKGDIARALFYMDVRYEGGDGEPDLVLGAEPPTTGCDCMGHLSTLLGWHVLDPVDARELQRNELIFRRIQGNRNPFIDHPEWVAAVWGGTPAPTPTPTPVTAPVLAQSVRLAGRHPAGVPLHSRAGGSPIFERVPDGSVAGVLATAEEGRWLNISLPDGRTGWISRQYVGAYLEATPVAPATPGASPEPTMLAHFIDVGQANATLLEFPCGAILLDAGAQDEARIQVLVQYLEDFFGRRSDLQRTLDSIVITHNHVDHTRALREVVEAFTVRRLIENGQRGGPRDPGDPDVVWVNQNGAARGVRVIQVHDAAVKALPGRQGLTSGDIDPVACDGVDPRVRILSSDIANDDRPNWNAGEFGDKNNHSIVVRVDYGESSFLFTGDLEEPAIETMVQYYAGTTTLDVDVWEVGHHGSANGTTFSLLGAMSPDIAVISMGPWDDQAPWTAWQYGHPRHEAVALLTDAIQRQREVPKAVHIARGQWTFYETTMHDAIYGTGWDGTVLLQANGAGLIRFGVQLP